MVRKEDVMNFIKLAVLMVLCVFFMNGCDSGKHGGQYSEPSSPKSSGSFNTSDKNVMSNGNVPVAMAKLISTGSDVVWKSTIAGSVESISKAPYSALGKNYKVSGEVYKIEELPPEPGLPGKWSEVLLLSRNPNSPGGFSTIDVMCNGDMSHLKSGQVVTFAGYFTGTHESQNAMGGLVEALVFVGTHF